MAVIENLNSPSGSQRTKNISRVVMIEIHLRKTCLCAIAFFCIVLTGCGAIEHAIEKDKYESTREEGTRNRDSGRFFVRELAPGTFRITYTSRVKGFDRTKGFDADKALLELDRKAAEVTLENGYSHFTRGGKGQTGREGIIMTKVIIKCYGNGEEIPPEAIDAAQVK